MNTYDNRTDATTGNLPSARFRAIRTHYVGPSNTKPGRIVGDAGDRASRVTVEWDHSLNSEQNHAYAAILVCRKMGWTGEYYTPLAGGGYGADTFWVFTDPEAPASRLQAPHWSQEAQS